MPQWTGDQQNVIGSSEKRIICSAAAGSGKTAVMIGRIARMIREGADPFSFLVITFTNAAAAEMKDRIRRRLLEEREDPVIAAAAEKAGIMEVSTIHAFCQHLIRQEFQAVGVDPLFRICTGAQREMLFGEAFRKACDKLRDMKDPDYLAFIRRYEPKEALEIVTAVTHFILSLPDPFGWLREKTENVPVDLDRDHPWFRTVSRMIRERVLAAERILRHMEQMFGEPERQEAYRASFIEDCARVAALRNWAETGEADEESLSQPFAKLAPLRNLNDLESDWKDRYQKLRGNLKDACAGMLSWIRPDREKMGREFTEIRNTLRGLRKLTWETHDAFTVEKARVCVLDFADLEHKALAILRDKDTRDAVRSRYRYVFVDECQDISSVQNELIDRLSGDENDLFMVGDVKQSIYRFRLANPKLFLDRTEDTEHNACYRLRENFRSRPEILDTVNTVFRDVMRRDVTGIGYAPEDELRFGKGGCEGYDPVRVDLLEIGDKKRLEAVADHTAERIREMISGGEIHYRDIVILMPEVSTEGARLTELLKDREIPVFFDGKGGFFDQPEVEIFRNLLTLLDDPEQDLPLLSVLVNPPFGLTEEELSLVRLKKTGRDVSFRAAFEAACGEDSPLGNKCREARDKLEAWRFRGRRMALDDFLWYLAEDSAFLAVFGAGPGGRAARKNLRNLCLQAEKAKDRGICSLREFLDYLTEQASGGEMQAASALGEGDDLVRLMTMHKSKGLQFPVVFCLGLDKGLGGRPGGAVRMDEELGLCLRYKVPEWRLSRKTAADEIFEWKKEHDIRAEKICLLYVAMTRAEKRLYLVGTEQDRALWHLPPGEHRVLGAADYLDLILPSLLDNETKSTSCTQASKPCEIRLFDGNQQETVETGKVIHSLRPWVDSLLSARPVDELWMKDPAEEAEDEAAAAPRKYSVTALLQEARNRIFLDGEQTPEEKRTPDFVRRAMKRYETERGPVFGRQRKEADGAARGTVIHRFLSLVDPEEIRRGGTDGERFSALLSRLTERQVFTPEEAAWIRPEKISRFFSSDIGRRMLASPEIHREWDFNLYLEDRNTVVQGIIDCAFREGDGWILLDYKTDRIRDEEAFLEEYRPQLEWYAAALRVLTGKPVRESWLYALSVDKAFRLSGAAESG